MEVIVGRKIISWVATRLVAAFGFISAFTYLSGNPQAVQGFTHVGYPQQLRIIPAICRSRVAICASVMAFTSASATSYVIAALESHHPLAAHQQVSSGIASICVPAK
jgi:hypothetical protein